MDLVRKLCPTATVGRIGRFSVFYSTLKSLSFRLDLDHLPFFTIEELKAEARNNLISFVLPAASTRFLLVSVKTGDQISTDA